MDWSPASRGRVLSAPSWTAGAEFRPGTFLYMEYFRGTRKGKSLLELVVLGSDDRRNRSDQRFFMTVIE